MRTGARDGHRSRCRELLITVTGDALVRMWGLNKGVNGGLWVVIRAGGRSSWGPAKASKIGRHPVKRAYSSSPSQQKSRDDRPSQSKSEVHVICTTTEAVSTSQEFLELAKLKVRAFSEVGMLC